MKPLYILSLFAVVGIASIGQPALATAKGPSDLGSQGHLFAIQKVAATATPLSDLALDSVVGTGGCYIGCVDINVNVANIVQINNLFQTAVAVGNNITQRLNAGQFNVGAIGQTNR